MRHYKTPNTHFLGRALWEASGIVENNPYGFVLRDEALVPWAKSREYDYAYGSPELNKLLSDYFWDILKKDPAFYLKVIYTRALIIVKNPLKYGIPPKRFVSFSESGLSFWEYFKRYPLLTFSRFFLNQKDYFFFFGGLLFLSFWLWKNRSHRMFVGLISVPLFYTLVFQLFVHFETRYLSVEGAWALSAAWAWGALQLWSALKKFFLRSEILGKLKNIPNHGKQGQA